MNNLRDDNLELITLENLRKRLLDLTTRNRLINFKHSKGSSLRIIDELPDQLVETLLADKEMRFLPVPEPTREQLIKAGYIEVDQNNGQEVILKKDPGAEEWAQWLGMESSYEVPTLSSGKPSSKHADKAIQTLLFPYELETRLGNLSQKAESAIEESGANILYMAFGFLEWYESKDSDISHLAPLFLVPVKLMRGRLNRETKTYEYILSYSGEDILPNLSLREKLKIDFALALPDLDEDTTPENYFKSVNGLIEKNQARWGLRRYITLALLNFSKLLMYLDLDPNRWPRDNKISNHPIVNGFLAGWAGEEVKDLSSGSIHLNEYMIDDLPDINVRYPLIDDADSSQHSAIIDAINGKNLVIEGPPGTGKSQTITNLIAVAMAHGKKVLFVAEKLAALEVVKRRLDAVGLGDFCLELHSHNTQKRIVFENLEERLEKRNKYRRPNEIEADIIRYEELKQILKHHVERINLYWKQTGKTINQIFMAATRYRQKLSINPQLLQPNGYDGDNLDAVSQRRIRDEIVEYSDVYRAVVSQLKDNTDLKNHPWYGVRNSELQIFDIEKVANILEQWQISLRELLTFRDEIAAALKCNESDIPYTLNGIEEMLHDLHQLPDLQGDELVDALPILRDSELERFQNYIELYENIQSMYESLVSKVGDQVLMNLDYVDQYSAGYESIVKLINKNLKLNEFYNAMMLLKTLYEDISSAEGQILEIISTIEAIGIKQIKLTASGLNELKIFIEIVSSLPTNYWKYRSILFDDEELDQLIPKIRYEITELHSLRIELEGVYQIHSLPKSTVLIEIEQNLLSGGVFRWFKGRWRSARKQLFGYSANQKVKLLDMVKLLDKAIEYQKRLEIIEDCKNRNNQFGGYINGVDTDIDLLETMRAWYKLIRKTYGIGFGNRVGLGSAILELSVDIARAIHSVYEHGILKDLDKILTNLEAFRNYLNEDSSLKSKETILAGENGEIKKCKNILQKAIEDCESIMANNDITLFELSNRVRELEKLRNKVVEWNNISFDNLELKERLGLSVDYNYHNKSALSVAKNTLQLASCLSKKINTTVIKNRIYESPDKHTYTTLCAITGQFKLKYDNEHDSRVNFSNITMLDWDAWTNLSMDNIANLERRNNLALSNNMSLQNWMDYVRLQHRLFDIGFGSLADKLEKGIIPIHLVEYAYYASIYDMLAREILRENPELTKFSGHSQESIQNKFKEYDLRLQKLHCENIAWKIDQNPVPGGNNSGRVSEYTECSLLIHECGKQKRHIALRQLLKRAGNALVSLKPCFMMGPMSVAQYLEPGQIIFDLVVMDEASQIKPEDSIGSVARGTQLIVVGDPKQLPPTNFFDRLIDDANEDEEDMAIQHTESILELCMPIFPVRRLCWHYRSQHQSLIAFSNHSFYNNGLVLFPSPHKESKDYGIQYSRVQRGYFVNRCNHEEAKIITNAVRQHFQDRPNESLGVIAMNAEQRDQIQRTIDELEKEDSTFRQLRENSYKEQEQLFIKNLENVQGDERDVIFLSMTYGPMEPGGLVHQRFGPINQENGWRRLNVLFTRSRKRMHVFSSMGSSDIIIGHNSKLGVKTLHNFLKYCETGIIYQTDHYTQKLPDSDFEIAVADALRVEGFECIPQIGVAGFFIDLAVIDPGNPGRFLMGIECDGATYHSAKSVRDRDRLRQAILERLGWRIQRIWSTDWFKNPDAVLVPIIRDLHKSKSEEIKISQFTVQQNYDEIRNKMEEKNKTVDRFLSGDHALREKLINFDKEVIRVELLDIPDNKRLLRPAMMEAFLEYKPTNKSEFFEYIPAHLRQSTDTSEGKFIESVLEIINSAID